jgi:hypothetical protein
MNMTARFWLRLLVRSLVLLSAPVAAGAAPAMPAPARVIDARKIWDQGEHNAFTDLIRWHGRWWCTFRESAAHVGGDGAIRVIESADGTAWTSAAYVTEKDIDLRDPKFSLTPDDRLMINCGGSIYLGTKQLKGRQPRVLFSNDGRAWTTPARVLREGDWLWRVTWRDGVAYGTSYANGVKAGKLTPADEWNLILYSSRDGLKWERVAPLDVTGRPNETTLRFLPNGDMVAMVRREEGNQKGLFGVASPPYHQWSWQESSHRFGGPNFIRSLDATSWIVCTRDHTTPPPGASKGVTTVVARLAENGQLVPLATLPSGGDCSYAGLAWHEEQLWVSYYSSHEGKSAIYLAKLTMR